MVTYMKYYETYDCFIPMLKTEFLAKCRAIGIVGGKTKSTYEVLKEEAEKGNEKAKELFDNIRRVEQ